MDNMQCSSSAMGGCSVVRDSAVVCHRGCGCRRGCAVQSQEGAVSQWVQTVFVGDLQHRRGRVQCTAVGACSAVGGHRAQCRGCSDMPCAHGGGAVQCPSGSTHRAVLCSPVVGGAGPRSVVQHSHTPSGCQVLGTQVEIAAQGGWCVKEQPSCVWHSAGSRGAGGSWAWGC